MIIAAISAAFAAGTGGAIPDTSAQATLNLSMGLILAGDAQIDCRVQGAGGSGGAYPDAGATGENEDATVNFYGEAGATGALLYFYDGGSTLDTTIAANVDVGCARVTGYNNDVNVLITGSANGTGHTIRSVVDSHVTAVALAGNSGEGNFTIVPDNPPRAFTIGVVLNDQTFASGDGADFTFQFTSL